MRCHLAAQHLPSVSRSDSLWSEEDHKEWGVCLRVFCLAQDQRHKLVSVKSCLK